MELITSRVKTSPNMGDAFFSYYVKLYEDLVKR